MPGFQTADYAAGLMACIGILAALRRRDRYGMGAALDIAMFDSMFNLGLLGLASALARASGASGEPAMGEWVLSRPGVRILSRASSRSATSPGNPRPT